MAPSMMLSHRVYITPQEPAIPRGKLSFSICFSRSLSRSSGFKRPNSALYCIQMMKKLISVEVSAISASAVSGQEYCTAISCNTDAVNAARSDAITTFFDFIRNSKRFAIPNLTLPSAILTRSSIKITVNSGPSR